jgi:murein DD-endopeptidase MepM/ murein hydrolase activator NlpD
MGLAFYSGYPGNVEALRKLDPFSVSGVVRAGIATGLVGGLAFIVLSQVADTRRETVAVPVALPAAPALLFPLQSASPGTVVEGFDARRGLRRHEAIDVPAPRGTPVRAAADGTVRLTRHVGAGITVEEDEASGRFCLVYAHLDRYVFGLRDGSAVVRGQTIGYVGTSGNAPRNVPHLHFAAHLRSGGGCWSGSAVDPLPLF